MTTLEAWALPPGCDPPRAVRETTTEPGGAVLKVPSVDPEEVRALCRRLRVGGEGLRERPVEDVARALGRVGGRFLDPDDPVRRNALEGLPAAAGLSEPMAREILDGMARDWTADRLLRLLRAELHDPAVLDGFRPGEGGGSVRAFGPDLGLHVCAGSVPGVSVGSLIRGLLVKSPVLLKPGREDVLLPVLFARALRDEDPELAGCVAVLYWPGGEAAVEDVALDEADTVVVYGGNDTVRSLRDRAPVTSRFVAYRHRVGAALVGREALRSGEFARRTAARAARAVATFDQRGCVSPHVVHVEGGGAVDPEAWTAMLADELEALEERLPSGPLRAAEASAIQQLRGTAELREAAGEGVRVLHGGDRPWTVLVERDPGFRPSCTGRVVRIRPVDGLEEAVRELSAVGEVLQTVALDGAGRRRDHLAESLGRAGAVRITRLDNVPWPPPWWHHDGRGPLRALIRWVDLDV